MKKTLSLIVSLLITLVLLINMDKLSELNQMARVKTFFKVDDPENDLTDEQKDRIKRLLEDSRK